MPKIRMRLNKLKEGMVLGSNVYTDKGIFLIQEGTIVDKEVLHILRQYFIAEVIVDYEDKKSAAFNNFRNQFEIVEDDIARNLEAIVFKDSNIDTKELLDNLNQIIESSSNSVALCDMLYRMKTVSDGVYSHCVNVALLSQLLGRWLSLTNEEVEILGLIGLLHDIGKLRFPPGLCEKIGPLTKQETIIYEKHVIDGYNIIKDKLLDNQVKQAVLAHHERIDGSGYPLHSDIRQINKMAKIVAVTDCYDHMLTQNEDIIKRDPFELARVFEEQYYGKLDPYTMMIFFSNVLDPFINRRVLLNNGEIGRIIFIKKMNLPQPLIQIGSRFADLAVRKDLKIVQVLEEE